MHLLFPLLVPGCLRSLPMGASSNCCEEKMKHQLVNPLTTGFDLYTIHLRRRTVCNSIAVAPGTSNVSGVLQGQRLKEISTLYNYSTSKTCIVYLWAFEGPPEHPAPAVRLYPGEDRRLADADFHQMFDSFVLPWNLRSEYFFQLCVWQMVSTMR